MPAHLQRQNRGFAAAVEAAVRECGWWSVRTTTTSNCRQPIRSPGASLARPETVGPESSGRGDSDSRRCDPRIRMLILRRDADREIRSKEHAIVGFPDPRGKFPDGQI